MLYFEIVYVVVRNDVNIEMIYDICGKCVVLGRLVLGDYVSGCFLLEYCEISFDLIEFFYGDVCLLGDCFGNLEGGYYELVCEVF